MIIINFTEHEITIAANPNTGEITHRFSPSGYVARINSTHEQISAIEAENGDIPVFKDCFGEVVLYKLGNDGRIDLSQIYQLPIEEHGTVYIVSMLVAQRARRNDFLRPSSGTTAIKDGKGNVLAVRGLCK